jgi:hypothetical protein
MEAEDQTVLDEHIPLRRFKVKMFGKSYVLNPAADLELQISTVGEALQEQASKYAFYATVRDMAQAKLDSLNAKLDNRRSELDQEYRQDGELPGGVKITEESMRRALRAHPDCAKLREQIVEAQFNVNTLNSIVRAFEHRRECAVSLSVRANNTTFHDRDVKVTVAAKISDINLDNVRSRGKHPSTVN